MFPERVTENRQVYQFGHSLKPLFSLVFNQSRASHFSANSLTPGSEQNRLAIIAIASVATLIADLGSVCGCSDGLPDGLRDLIL